MKPFENIFDAMLNDTSIRLEMYEMLIERLYNENMEMKIEIESFNKKAKLFDALDADTKSLKYKIEIIDKEQATGE